MRAVELFVGAGGMALGVGNAGFTHDLSVEWNKDACQTLRTNRIRNNGLMNNWGPIFQEDVRNINFGEIVKTEMDLLAGGPPCQPFSLGGKHQGYLDERDMFPQVARAVKELRPRSFIIENVRGLTRETFSKYFEFILLQMTYPELGRKGEEGWKDHLARLEKQHTTGRIKGLNYRVVFQVLNAADFGVPQKRERVFIVGLRSDLNQAWSFPRPTHSYESLVWSQHGTGEYWDTHKVPLKKRAKPNLIESKILDRLRKSDQPLLEKRWKTVRDAISDLPDPGSKNSLGIENHDFAGEAKIYPGHTGSVLDLPAKTLKAGDHGVPGGENMVVLPNGKIRYFSVREAARLQTFPDQYGFSGKWTECMRQIGNAVPVKLAEIVARSVSNSLIGKQGYLNV